MEEGDTLANAVIGGLVTFLTGSFVPLAPVLGGAIAGYMQGGSRRDGLKVGAYSGLVAFVPTLLLVSVVGSVLGIVGIGLGILGSGVALGFVGFVGTIVLFFVLVTSFLYFVGGGAIGGWLGNYVKYDTEVEV